MGRRKPIEWEVNKNGCHICTSHAKDKVGYIHIKRDGKMQRMHRYLYQEKYGCLSNKTKIRHKCDNPSCINIEHLEAGTQKENIHDCIDRGWRANLKGENVGSSKLIEKDVLYIFNSKLSYRKLASLFNVSKTTIASVKNKRTWKHLF